MTDQSPATPATGFRPIPELLADHGVDLGWQGPTYRHLHANPELSAVEFETSRYLEEQLSRFDCEVKTGFGGTGLVGIFRNGDGPTVLYRADIDALPVEETTGVDYASVAEGVSREGVATKLMHACGHDHHMTAGLGACAILDGNRDQWSGTFIMLFQPAEETASGAQSMVDDGLVQAIPRPDACLGLHVVPGPAGRVMSAAGPVLTGCDTITIDITGRAAHGSMPHNGVDPTYIAAAVVLRLQGIVGREVSPHEFAVISVGTLTSGNSNNTIPGHARIVLNIRFYSDEVREILIAAIERVVRAECMASGADVEPRFGYSDHGDVTDNDPEVFAAVREAFDGVFGEESVTAERWTASEDFSDIPNAFGSPYVYWTVGVTPREQWDAAVAADRVLEDVPSNHMSTFLPDYAPTVDATTRSAAAAILACLRR
ncbi:MAG TPA: amidohydrolase [Actinomycetales bacterium]|uniref:amidohydrolase n=1 Tax=uncultured Corynebacterium sp. TaxID=159447 RepID=UPI001779ABC9|nr:amidohydrolase [uncultured Corynebacterium sp.]HHU45538.1 amidohydrolase [Actinomycetales bacterium]